MTRTGAGILTFMLLVGLIVGSAPKPVSGNGAGAVHSQNGGIPVSGKRRKRQAAPSKPCQISEDTIQFKVIDAVRTSLNRGSASNDECAESYTIGAEQVEKDQVHVAFAIVPDPVHTNLSLFFDRQMDAMQQAIMDSQWIFERAVMPWDNKDHPEPDDFHIRVEQQLYDKQQQDQPGILIFRHPPENESTGTGSAWTNGSDNGKAATDAGKKPPAVHEKDNEAKGSGDKTVAGATKKKEDDPARHRLLVFVIGESATAGVEKAQFRNAITLVKQLFGEKFPEKLPVFGPTFSGSLHSLGELLNCANTPDFPCNAKRSVFSGTVTSAFNIKRFRQKAQVPFVSLQENDEYVLNVFLKFATETWGYSCDQIAVVSEDETVYGTKGSDGEAVAKTECQGPVKEGNASDKSEISKQPNESTSTLVHVYFPREISQLRNAYQHNLTVPAASEDKTPRRTLPLDLDSSGTDDDSIPEYSQKQYPLSQEAVLLGIVGELEKHGVQVILLRATSPLDQFFLSRYLRQAYPNGRIITVSSDLLFSREVEDARLHGVMALTTYSLTPGADHEFQDPSLGHSDRVFPSTHSVGTYNAMKLLLAANFHIGAPDEGCPKLPPASAELKTDELPVPCVHLYQYGWPGKELTLPPPVYLTVLGRERYWRVAVLPQEPPSLVAVPFSGLKSFEGSSLPLIPNPQISKRAGPDKDSSPLAIWNLLWIIAIGISLGYAYFVWSASILSSSQAVAQLAPAVRDSRRYLLAGAAYLHFAVLFVLLWPYKYGFQTFSPWPEGFLILALCIVAFVGTCDLVRRGCHYLAVVFPLACALTPVTFILPRKIGDFHQMAVYRSIYLTSGVSHVFSVLLFLGAGLWGVWYSLAGTCLLDSIRTILPQKSEIETTGLKKAIQQKLLGYRSMLEEDQSRLTELMRPDVFDGRAVIVCVIGVSGVLLFTGFHPIHSLEPVFHQFLLIGMAIFTFVFLVAGVLRVHNIWTELRQLLISLDSVPLRRAFRRLKGLSWSPLWRMGGGNLGDFHRLIGRQAEAWHCVLSCKAKVLDLVKESYCRPEVLDQLQTNYQTQAGKTRGKYEAAWDHFLGRHEHQTADSAIGSDTKSDNAGQGTSFATGSAEPGAAPTAAATAPAREPVTKEQPVSEHPKGRVNRWWGRVIGWPRNVEEQGREEKALLQEFQKLQEQFATAGLHTLGIAIAEWDKATTPAYDGTEDNQSSGVKTPAVSTDSPSENSADGPFQNDFSLRDATEYFLALLYTSFITIVLVRVRTLIITIGGMYVFSLLALTTYPFQPQGPIRLFLLLLLIFMVAVVGTVYAQMHRDATLSHITNTEPGELGPTFWLRIASFVALPVLSLLASQYPSIGNLLSSWLQPALNALH